MSTQEKKWWRKLEKVGDYIMLTPIGRRGVASMWGEPENLYTPYRLSIHNYTTYPPEPGCLFYGPFEDGEIFDVLWSELPAPPARLPKSHPDRFLARVATIESWGDREAYVTAGKEDGAGYISIAWCKDQSPSNCLARYLSYIPGRYAQQDLDGVWREVDASDDPRVRQETQQVEEVSDNA